MKAIQWIISALVAVVIIAAAVGGGVYFTRLKSIHSIRKLTDYENYNLYRMDIDYAYDLDRLIDRGITDNQSMDQCHPGRSPALSAHPYESPKLWLQRVLHPGHGRPHPDGPQL